MSDREPGRPSAEDAAGTGETAPADAGGESASETSDEAVRQRLEALRRDPDVRWHMSRHTLELAINALEGDTAETEAPRPASKSRRRRKRKRFL